jgi:uncharacterized OB-fold protein
MSELAPVAEGLFDDEGLIGGSCGACGLRHFPLAGHCPWCGAADVSEVRLSTEGRLWSWTAVHSAPPGYEGPVPFGFGVVELVHEQLRVIARLRESDPARLEFGQAMTLVADELPNGVVTWAFA